MLLPDKVVCPRYFNLAAELCLRWQLLVLQNLVNGHLVALAVRVHLRRHLVREQVELAPGELDVGKGENTGESAADIDLRVGQPSGFEGGLRHRRIDLKL